MKLDYISKINSSLLENIIQPGGIYDYLEIPRKEETEGYLDKCNNRLDENLPYNPDLVHKPNIKDISQNLLILSCINMETYTHSLRCALYSVRVMDFLNIKDKQQRSDFFTSSLFHDIGKCCVIGNEIGREFKEEDIEKIKSHHSDISAEIMRRNFGENIAGIVERHHKYQKNPYPKILRISETPEIRFYSKLLALIDFNDSASTRLNGKYLPSFIWKFLKKMNIKNPPISKKKVKNLVIEEYGNQNLDYESININEKELIDDLFQVKIFGVDNPINPFEKFGSFRYP